MLWKLQLGPCRQWLIVQRVVLVRHADAGSFLLLPRRFPLRWAWWENSLRLFPIVAHFQIEAALEPTEDHHEELPSNELTKNEPTREGKKHPQEKKHYPRGS